jgi:SAM-dependent methyltransferase
MDPFGEAVRDRFEGSATALVIEREDGYTDEDSLDSYFASPDDFPQCEKDALGRVRGRVLDIGVGPGRVALLLQEKGHEVVGVDLSDEVLDIARARGVKNAVKMSACDLRFPRSSFETVVAFGNNFGLCGSPEGVMSMLLRLRDMVTDDGVFLAESIDPLNTTLPQHLRYHEYNVSRGRMKGHVTIRLVYRRKAGEWFDLLLVTPTEMKILAERTGWSVESTHYMPETEALFVSVLKKI